MRQKEFSKREVKIKIKEIKKIWKNNNLQGEAVSLKQVLGNYQYNSMLRYIKETLFFNTSGTMGRNGAIWYFKYPKKNTKKLAKKVMRAINVTR